jgi:membrane fusion protein, multidrug efflux system
MNPSRTPAIPPHTETVARRSAEPEDRPDSAKAADAPNERPGPPESKADKSPRWRRHTLFALLPIALLVSAYVYVTGGGTMSTDNAYVQADTVGISTDVSGVVKVVDVTENERVTTNQVLYQLDRLPFQLAASRARALIDIVRNNLRALQASYRDTQEQVRQAQADLAYYDRELKRQQYLSAQHVSSEQTLEAAHRSRQNAQQKLASLTQQLAGIAANLNGDPNASVEEHPQYLDAVAQAREAARQLDHTIVRAPFAGIVTNVPSIAPGKYLQASATAFYLVATDHVWVDANPKETELTYVRIGQPVEISVDTYPSFKWKGAVESISPAAAQQFSLLPAQNTSGNWVKVVQRIPMRVRVDTADTDLRPLRAGMSVEVGVHTGHRRAFPLFGDTRSVTRGDK